jgi:hypothetical protein
MSNTKNDIDVEKLVSAIRALAHVQRGLAKGLQKMLIQPAADDLLAWTERRLAEVFAGLGVAE